MKWNKEPYCNLNEGRRAQAGSGKIIREVRIETSQPPREIKLASREI